MGAILAVLAGYRSWYDGSMSMVFFNPHSASDSFGFGCLNDSRTVFYTLTFAD
jgi:hypothetical protein